MDVSHKNPFGLYYTTLQREFAYIFITLQKFPQQFSLRFQLSLPGLALGKPKEKVVVVPVGADGDVRYYRDADQVHYVPKRSLDEIIL